MLEFAQGGEGIVVIAGRFDASQTGAAQSFLVQRSTSLARLLAIS